MGSSIETAAVKSHDTTEWQLSLLQLLILVAIIVALVALIRLELMNGRMKKKKRRKRSSSSSSDIFSRSNAIDAVLEGIGAAFRDLVVNRNSFLPNHRNRNTALEEKKIMSKHFFKRKQPLWAKTPYFGSSSQSQINGQKCVSAVTLKLKYRNRTETKTVDHYLQGPTGRVAHFGRGVRAPESVPRRGRRRPQESHRGQLRALVVDERGRPEPDAAAADRSLRPRVFLSHEINITD